VVQFRQTQHIAKDGKIVTFGDKVIKAFCKLYPKLITGILIIEQPAPVGKFDIPHGIAGPRIQGKCYSEIGGEIYPVPVQLKAVT
jgi:hypothetical protein